MGLASAAHHSGRVGSSAERVLSDVVNGNNGGSVRWQYYLAAMALYPAALQARVTLEHVAYIQQLADLAGVSESAVVRYALRSLNVPDHDEFEVLAAAIKEAALDDQEHAAGAS